MSGTFLNLKVIIRMKFTTKAKLVVASLLFMGATIMGLGHVTTAHAAVANTTPTAKVSFTFDDGLASSLTQAAPTLAQYGYSGTNYVITSCVGMTKIPNKCPADTDQSYMTWAQIKTLQNTYGWEIGSHSVTHPLMSELTAAKLEQEALNSKTALQAQGFKPTAFAAPYGDYSDKTIAGVAKHYSSFRGFADTGYNVWPYNNYLIRVQQVQAGVSVATVKSYIDQAAADNTWLVLVFHEVKVTPSVDPEDYQYSTADLSSIAAYVKSRNIKVTNITNGLVTAASTDNQVTEPVSGTTLGNGWTTDTPASVKVDTASNGNDVATNKTSVQVKANTTKNVHLFTPTTNVTAGNTYVIKGYVNMTAMTSGSIGFYVDEYDASGNWISGKYVQTVSALYVKDLSFIYTASSVEVAKARLQIIITANSGITVYFDSIQWVTTSGPAPTPPTPPTPPVTPVVTNLLTNGSFDTGMTGWTTDTPTSFVTDGATHGDPTSTPVTSIKFTAPTGTRNAHMFSSSISVTSTKSYKLSGYLNIVTLSSKEVAFYIDEYDASGNWISGQYLYAQRAVGAGNFSFNYKPSSANVAKSSLQVIVETGSGITGYIDNLSWATV